MPRNKAIPTRLTARQTAFVKAFLARGMDNATEAAKEAGYSETNITQAAYRLVHNTPGVSEIIADRKRKIEEKLDIGLEKRIQNNLKVFDSAFLPDHNGDLSNLHVAHKVNQHLSEIYGDLAVKETKNTNHNLNLTAVALVKQYERDY